jgi:hypothetical protein
MRKGLIAFIALAAFVISGNIWAAEDKDKDKDKKDKGWNGVLIDAACGAKKNEEDAADHPKSCAMKEACAKSGYGIVHGEKFIKFDDKGNKLAKEYLAEKEHTTKVHVDGELSKDEKEIKVSAIHGQDDKEHKDKKEKAAK